MAKRPRPKLWMGILGLLAAGMVWTTYILRSTYLAAADPGARQYEFGWIFAAVICLICGAVGIAGTIELSERSPEEVSPDSAWPTALAIATPFLMGFVFFMVLAFVDLMR